MGIGEAYAILGLESGASPQQVHAAYRRLALKYHPDRNPGHENLEHFKRLAAAYRLLRNKFRLDRTDSQLVRGVCDRCGEYAVVHQTLDGSRSCATCLSFFNRRPLLPAPTITIVTCATTIVLLALALGCLLAGLILSSPGYLLMTIVLGVSALVSLAVTCVTVVYTADPHHLSRRRT